MKSICILLTSLLALSVLSAQSAEEAAIMEVVEQETAAAFANDYEAWASHWVHEPYAYFNYSDKNTAWNMRGWESISETLRESMQTSAPNTNPVKRNNINIRISGDMAWVTFDQDDGIKKWEQRVMEKHDGEWKIVNMTAIGGGTYDESGKIHRTMFFQFKPGTSDDQIAEVAQLFEGLPARVDGMLEAVWMSSGNSETAYTHSVILEFKDEDAVTAYEKHPDHLRLMELGDLVAAYSGETYRRN